jgi:hypothetical protein
MQTLHTVEDFALHCAGLTTDEIYELFENGIYDSLKDELYALADTDTPEPCRSAMINIGIKYDIQSLISY